MEVSFAQILWWAGLSSRVSSMFLLYGEFIAVIHGPEFLRAEEGAVGLIVGYHEEEGIIPVFSRKSMARAVHLWA